MIRRLALVLAVLAVPACGTSLDPSQATVTPVISVPQSPTVDTVPTTTSRVAASSSASAPAESPAAPVLDTGGAAKIGGVRVAPSTLREDDGALCSEVLYVNEGPVVTRVSPFDWRLQLPSGAVIPPVLTTRSFTASEVPVRQSFSGTLCFRPEVLDEGGYALLYLAPDPRVDVAVFQEQR